MEGHGLTAESSLHLGTSSGVLNRLPVLFCSLDMLIYSCPWWECWSALSCLSQPEAGDLQSLCFGQHLPDPKVLNVSTLAESSISSFRANMPTNNKKSVDKRYMHTNTQTRTSYKLYQGFLLLLQAPENSCSGVI